MHRFLTITLRGEVVRGAERGKQLGFPTANLKIDPGQMPEAGIYAAWIRIEGEDRWRPGAVNIGYTPTFRTGTEKFEVYLLDYSGNLYGKILEVNFIAFLRPEMEFETREELIRQIAADCLRVRSLVAKIQPPAYPQP